MKKVPKQKRPIVSKSPIPGTPVATVIFAEPGTVGEKVLEQIAHPPDNRGSMKYPRKFGLWNGEVCEGSVCAGESRVTVKLVLGERKRGIEIRQVAGRALSLRTTQEGEVHVLKIGSLISDSRAADLANKIVATFICHGNGWQDRKGDLFSAPHGSAPSGKKRKRETGAIRKEQTQRM